MATERSCAGVRERLEQALLSRSEIGREEREHLAECAACAGVRARLRDLATALESAPAPEPRPELVAATLARARTALTQAGAAERAPAKQGREAAAQRARKPEGRASGTGSRRAPARLAPPAGFRGELVRLLAGAAAPLPLVLLWNWAVLALGGELLAPFLPAPLLAALAVGWGLAAAGWLALLYGSIPFLAHRRAVRRLNEVPS